MADGRFLLGRVEVGPGERWVGLYGCVRDSGWLVVPCRLLTVCRVHSSPVWLGLLLLLLLLLVGRPVEAVVSVPSSPSPPLLPSRSRSPPSHGMPCLP
jgi:hypothetical protein